MTNCENRHCKRVSPKSWLTWCNIKTLIYLAIGIYWWLTH